jgi:hypothetical protein
VTAPGARAEINAPRVCRLRNNPYEFQLMQCLAVTMGHAVVTLDWGER